jgi:hypothetical protein
MTPRYLFTHRDPWAWLDHPFDGPPPGSPHGVGNHGVSDRDPSQFESSDPESKTYEIAAA